MVFKAARRCLRDPHSPKSRFSQQTRFLITSFASIDQNKRNFGGIQLFIQLFIVHKSDFKNEGMLSVMSDLVGVDWGKVFWIGTDGASVMKKLATLIEQHLSPFSFWVWCSNHLNNLLLKDCVFGIPEISHAIDSLSEGFKLFHKAPKAMSRLRISVPENHEGPQTLKRAERLTRWTAILTSAHAMINLLPFLFEVWCDMLNDENDRKNVERTDRVEKLLSFWCSYKNIAILALLKAFGTAFVVFHQKMQDRGTDFTTLPFELKRLRKSVNLCLDERKVKGMVKEVVEVLEKCKAVKNLAKMGFIL
jgi:hypothetical protein